MSDSRGSNSDCAIALGAMPKGSEATESRWRTSGRRERTAPAGRQAGWIASVLAAVAVLGDRWTERVVGAGVITSASKNTTAAPANTLLKRRLANRRCIRRRRARASRLRTATAVSCMVPRSHRDTTDRCRSLLSCRRAFRAARFRKSSSIGRSPSPCRKSSTTTRKRRSALPSLPQSGR